MGYHLYDPKCRRIVYSRDVKFNESGSGIEKEFSSGKLTEPRVIIEDTEIAENDDSLSEETEELETDGDTESCVNDENESITVRQLVCLEGQISMVYGSILLIVS